MAYSNKAALVPSLSWICSGATLALLLFSLGAPLRAQVPLAGNVVLRAGSLTHLRGKAMKSRRVEDFASLQFGDVLRLESTTRADLATFDSGSVALDGEGNYRIMRDGVYRQVPNGKVRIYEFSELLGATRRARQVEVLRGSLGTLKPVGEVWVKRSGTRSWTEILRDTELRYHDQVRTGSQSRVVVAVDSRTDLILEEESQALFQSGQVLLERGAMASNWRRRGTRFEVHTASSEILARGPVFRVQVGSPDRIECLEGRVEVSPRGGRGSRQASEGERVLVDSGARTAESSRFSGAREARAWARSMRTRLRELPGNRSDRSESLDALFQDLEVLRGESMTAPVGQEAPPEFAGLTPPESAPAPARYQEPSPQAVPPPPVDPSRSISSGEGTVHDGGWVVSVDTSPPGRAVSAAAPAPVIPVLPPRIQSGTPPVEFPMGSIGSQARASSSNQDSSSDSQTIPSRPAETRSNETFDSDPLGAPVPRRRRPVDLASAFQL